MLRVLNCAQDPELRSLRAAILMLRDCEVVSPDPPEEALREMHSKQFDVLILCYQLNLDTIETLGSEFRKLCPAGKIVAIEYAYVSRQVTCKVDAVVGAHDPSKLVEIVTSRLGKLIQFPQGEDIVKNN